MFSQLNRFWGSKSTNSRRRVARYMTLESLEPKQMFTTDLLSAFALGNETDEMIPAQIALDSAGNRYVTGSFGGTVDFEPGSTRPDASDVLTANGMRDGFIAKYSANNSLVWIKQFGSMSDIGIADDAGTGIALDTSGNVLVSGRFGAGVAAFAGGSVTSLGGIDGVVAKLNSSTGAVLWVSTWGGPADDRGGELAVDGSGNAFVSLETYNVGKLFPATAIALQKFSASGIKQWQDDFVTTPSSAVGQSIIRDVATDSSGNVYIVGTVTKASTDFDPSSKKSLVSTSGGATAYAAKYDNNGTLKWVSPFYASTSNSGSSSALSVTVDSAGSVLVGGGYSGSVDFDASSATRLLTGGGGYIAKLSANSGSLTWAKSLLQTVSPSAGYVTYVTTLTTDSAGNVFAAGVFQNSVDLDPSSLTAAKTSHGSWDIFLLNLNASGQFGWAEAIGGSGEDWVNDIDVGSDGSLSIAGGFSSIVDFAPSPDTYELTAPGRVRTGYLASYRRN